LDHRADLILAGAAHAVAQEVPRAGAARPAARRLWIDDDLFGFDAEQARRRHDHATRLDTELVVEVGKVLRLCQSVADLVALQMIEIIRTDDSGVCVWACGEHAGKQSNPQ
jgi:hypothetical protein